MIVGADARAIERATLAAVPPRELVEDDGWLLCANDGAIGRANSVTPLDAGADALDAKIDRAIAFYRARGLPPAFRVSPFSEPSFLPEALAARGFEAGQETLVEVAEIGAALASHPAPLLRVRCNLRPSADWLAVFLASSTDPDPAQRVRLETLQRAGNSVFFGVETAGALVAVGVCALHASGWAGVHGMRTRPEARRRGCARAIVRACAAAAREEGAGRLYLQVEAANAPARALYRGMGFSTAYGYSYWRRR